MSRFSSSVKKEYLLLISDRVGLLFMFVMPIILVLLLTIIQDSAYRKINENQITLLLANQDDGEPAAEFVQLLEESGLFEIALVDVENAEQLKHELIAKKKLAAVYIPSDFSEKIIAKSNHVSSVMLADLMLVDMPEENGGIEMPDLIFFHDPIMQESYSYTIMNVLYSYLNIVENSLMLDVVYELIGFEGKPDDFKNAMIQNKVNIKQTPASTVNIIPNTTQHMIPAWTIFAMFFMVVSLGSNIIRERKNGSFTRLKTMPVNFTLIFGSKMFIYVIVALIQVVVIFSVGVFVFPVMNLPGLVIPQNIPVLFLVVIITAIAAVSYALMIGSLARTQEQANGVGAVSIIIFAALGGILVPVFVMPEVMKTISKISPLYWCLESFYFLFLKGGTYLSLLKNLIPIFIFMALCQIATYIKLKQERIIG